MDIKVDLTKYENWLSWQNRVGRALWIIVCGLLFRPAFPSCFWPWRRTLLRMFGAKVDRHCNVYADVKIWAPWNLELGNCSSIASGVNVYNTGRVRIGRHTVISQGAYLCPGSHDITDPKFRMICGDLVIGDQVWIGTEAFVGGLGVHVNEGAVVGARAVVTKDVSPWSVVVGNPAREVKKRIIRSCADSQNKANSAKES